MKTSERNWLRNSAFGIVLFLFMQVQQGNAKDSCTEKLPNSIGAPFMTSSLQCTNVWANYNFILRYYGDNSTKIVSIVLSADNDNSYYAIGFSQNGKMVPATAMVGWVDSNGKPVLKSYSLQGQTPETVIPNATYMLTIVPGSQIAFAQNGTLYLAFQIQLDQLSTFPIYAIGPAGALPGSDYKLQQHRDYTSTTLDFSTGASSSIDFSNDRSTHGVLNIFGWGVLLPIGAITARYFKMYDPTWFYLHIAFQTTGFLFITAGLALGFKVVHQGSSANYDSHRAIGIIVFVVAILQVFLAFLLRPKKEAKVRKYWNWYHRSVGILAIILAIVNIYVGIHISHAGSSWKVGYGVALTIILAGAVSLEAVYWYKRLKQPAAQPHGTGFRIQMQSFP